MEFLPKSLGTRPRLAVELRTEGLVAARADDALAILTSTARVELAPGALAPGLRHGNIVDRTGVVEGLRKVVEDATSRGGGRDGSRDITLVVPDASVRVLLLEFDELPGNSAEALAVVRFRLKKLLPFDADDAAVSYQVMSSSKGSVQVLAIAMPREVLQEYENVVRSAGYFPGAILPSTISVLAGMESAESAALLVNACSGTLTAAILRGGVLLLHRSVELEGNSFAAHGGDVGGAASGAAGMEQSFAGLDGADALSVMESARLRHEAELGGVSQVPDIFAAEAAASTDVGQVVSVAAAYFEDTLGAAPLELLTAGVLSAERMSRLLLEEGFEDLRVREVMEPGVIDAGAVTSQVPRGWLAGVRGALKN